MLSDHRAFYTDIWMMQWAVFGLLLAGLAYRSLLAAGLSGWLPQVLGVAGILPWMGVYYLLAGLDEKKKPASYWLGTAEPTAGDVRAERIIIGLYAVLVAALAGAALLEDSVARLVPAGWPAWLAASALLGGLAVGTAVAATSPAVISRWRRAPCARPRSEAKP